MSKYIVISLFFSTNSCLSFFSCIDKHLISLSITKKINNQILLVICLCTILEFLLLFRYIILCLIVNELMKIEAEYSVISPDYMLNASTIIMLGLVNICFT